MSLKKWAVALVMVMVTAAGAGAQESKVALAPMDLVHQAYKFDIGASVGFPVYNPPRGAIEVALGFVAKEKLPLKSGGTIDAIKLSFNNRSHLWVDARDGRLLVNGGGTGGNAFWKVRSDVDAKELIKASL